MKKTENYVMLNTRLLLISMIRILCAPSKPFQTHKKKTCNIKVYQSNYHIIEKTNTFKILPWKPCNIIEI